MFADTLARFDRLRREAFGLDEPGHDALRREVARWCVRAIEVERAHELTADRGIEL